MNFARTVELSLVPTVVAAATVWAADRFVVPMLISAPICINPSVQGRTVRTSVSTMDMLVKLLIDALAIWIGMLLGQQVNRFFA